MGTKLKDFLPALKELSRDRPEFVTRYGFCRKLKWSGYFILVRGTRLITDKWTNYFYLASFPCFKEWICPGKFICRVKLAFLFWLTFNIKSDTISDGKSPFSWNFYWCVVWAVKERMEGDVAICVHLVCVVQITVCLSQQHLGNSSAKNVLLYENSFLLSFTFSVFASDQEFWTLLT